MVKYGDADKAVWISEAGWNTVPEGMEERYGQVDEEQQARYAVQAYERAQAEWPWAGVINYWFLKRPSDSEIDQPWYYFRLMEPDFTPTQAFNALAEFAPGREMASVETQTSLFFSWQRIRPALALISGSVLFFWLLSYLAPKP
jgi:hypothetical protein